MSYSNSWSPRRSRGHRRDRYSRSRSPPRRRRRYDDRRDRYDDRRNDYRDRRDRYDDRRDRYDDRRRGRDRRDRYDNRRRGRSRSPGVLPEQPLDRFRHRSLSLVRPSGSDLIQENVELQEKEIAYVFGRMGTTKDKLARVSGTVIDLEKSGLKVEGTTEAVARGQKYVQILLAQRHGVVELDTTQHKDDLTLINIPTNCKGFVTGRGGATLRQIERECATLMTFCTTQDENEPLAIFGSRRGRLQAQLKVMSIVEGKSEGWFVKDGDDPPEVEILDTDKVDDDWGVSFTKLQPDMIGYALGRGGETRTKLQIASGCIIQYIGLWAAFGGRKKEQSRGKTYLNWLLDQQNDSCDVDTTGRDDLKMLWVPEPCVGYVTGVKAKTLRNLETKTGTFCFFIKDPSQRRRDKEKMLIFSWSGDFREAAAEEVHMIVDFHQKKVGGNARVEDVDSNSRSASRDSQSKSYSRSRSNDSKRKDSRSRSRSYSRSKSPERTSLKDEK